MLEELKNRIKPFYLWDYNNTISLCLGDLTEASDKTAFKWEIFISRTDEGFIGSGYDWLSLAQVFLAEKMPELKGRIDFDNTSGECFCAMFTNEETLKKFALEFRAMCDDDKLMRNLFSKAKSCG